MINDKLNIGLRGHDVETENLSELSEKLKEYGDVIITTDDGSLGYKGNVVDYLKNHTLDFDKYFAKPTKKAPLWKSYR